MTLPTILVVGDHGQATGFERVIRGITTHLLETGEFSLVGRGIGYGLNGNDRAYPYPVLPASFDAGSMLGTANFGRWLEQHTPDAVLFVQDLWNIATYLGHGTKDLPVVAYYPVDTPNLKADYCASLGAVGERVVYTNFGAYESALGVRAACDRIMRAGVDPAAPITRLELPHGDLLHHLRADWLCAAQEPSGYTVIPHGLDPAEWQPVDRKTARAYFGLPQDAFIITNVNTNQFRKRLDTTIRIFARVARVRKDALLVLHCHGGDRNGWDLMQLAHYFGVQDRVVLVHALKPVLSEEELATLYSVADLNINTSGGEGWGLNSVHSAACGVPQAVPDWSATAEIWEQDEAIKFEVSDYRMEPRGINTAHAILDVRSCADAIITFAESTGWRQALTEGAARFVARQWSWEQVGAAFAERLRSALAQRGTEPAGTSFNDWKAARYSRLVGLSTAP